MNDGSVNIGPFVSDLRSVIQQRDACVNPADRLYQRLTALGEFADRLSEASADPGALAKLLEHSTPTSFRVGNVGTKGNWPNDAHLEIREAMVKLGAEREALRLAAVLSSIAPVYNAIREFVLAYADERRRRGRLGFQDLLVRCRNLLVCNSEIAARVRERYRYLLIDEFQDTDALQTEIANAIAQDEAGRLFFVGDPKQSIYRFRRADIEQYNAVRERYAESQVHLTQNFRSQPGVTKFVNAVFGPLMQADRSDGQAAWEDLDAAREPCADENRVAVTVVGDERDANMPQVRESEVKQLVEIIVDAQASGWRVLDQEDHTWRAARYADIAVLVPTRTGLARLLPQLEERGIPYRLESRSLVYDSEEGRGLLGILRAIDDPTDQIALLGSLRSPAFACSDDDLFRWSEACGQWDYCADVPAGIHGDHPVADAMRWLRAASAAQWRLSVSALVEYVIRERRLMELAVVGRRPRDRWQRLRFLLDQARAFCDGGGRTLNQFLQWAQRQADEDTRVIESVVPEPDNDAVRILTIHGAKGLEFPIVVPAGINVEPRDERSVLLWGANDVPQLYFKQGLKTPGYEALYAREEQLERAERVRLNYVAATRARDHLVTSLYRKAKENKQSNASIIAEQVDQLPEGAGLFRRFTPAQIVQRSPSQGKLPKAEGIELDLVQAPPDTAEARAQWLAERETAIQVHAAFAVESATTIAKRANLYGPNLEKSEPPDDLSPWRRGRAGTSVGRAVHSALQTINIAEPNDAEIRAAADAQSAAEGLPRRAAVEVARLIRTAVNSKIVREAVAGRYWRELYVAAPIANGDGDGGETLVEGFIDLLYETADGELVVVDYKTDALQEGEAVDAALSRYQLQGAAYAMALEASLGEPVSACRFLFLHADEERDVAELAGAIAQVRRILQEPVAG